MALFWELMIFYLTGILLFAHIGWSMLALLPRSLVHLRLVLWPILGLMGTCLGLSLLNVFGVSVSHGIVFLLLVGTLANLMSLRRKGYVSPGLSEPWPVLWLFSAGLYCVTVSPLLFYGYVAPIGAGWDFEFYWPVAEYLKTRVARKSIIGPPNPLLGLVNQSDVKGLGGWGFSVVQAALGVLLGRDSSWTFTPLLGCIYSLMPLSVYAFARTVAAFGRWPSLLIALLAGLNSVLLWTPYFNFAAHTLFLTVSPLTIAAVQDSMRERDAHSIAFGAVALAAMLVSYLPGSMVFALPLAALGTVEVLTAHNRLGTLGAAAGVLGLSGIFGFFGWQRAFERGLPAYGVRKPGPGISAFLPTSDWLGMTPFDSNMGLDTWSRLYGEAAATIILPVARGLTFALLVLLVVGFVSAIKTRHWPLIAVCVPLLALALVLRFIERYPYGYLKSASYTLFAVLVLAVAGFFALWETCKAWRPQIACRGARLLLVLIGMAVMSLNTYNGYAVTARYYGSQALYYGAEHSSLLALRQIIPDSANVYISGDAGIDLATRTLLSQIFLGHEVRGRYRTGYSGLNNLEPGRVYDYAVLDAREQPEPLGYAADGLLWRNTLVSVYKRGPVLAHVGVHETRKAWPFSRDRTLTVEISPASLGIGDMRMPQPPEIRGVARAQVALVLAAKPGQRITIETTKGTANVVARGGMTLFHSATLNLPARLAIKTDAPSRGYLVWLRLLQGGSVAPGTSGVPNLGFLNVETTSDPQTLSTSLRYYLAGQASSRSALEIWSLGPTQQSEVRQGYWSFDPPEEGGQELEFRLRRATQQVVLAPRRKAGMDRERRPLALRDGRYFAALAIYSTRLSRRDVCRHYREDVYPGACSSGFGFEWDTSRLYGSHAVAIRVTDGGGLTTVLEAQDVTVTGTNTPPVGFLDTPKTGATVSGTASILGWVVDRETPSADLALNLFINGNPVNAPVQAQPIETVKLYEFSIAEGRVTDVHVASPHASRIIGLRTAGTR